MVKGLNKEIIVIDDCSTDDTINIIKDIKDIIIISHEKTKARVLLSEPVSPRQTAILFWFRMPISNMIRRIFCQ